MKTTIVLLFVVIFGSTTRTYSQLSRQRGTDARRDQFQSKKYDDFGNYNFDKFSFNKVDKFSNNYFDKFNDFLSKRERNRPAQGNSQSGYMQRNNMPCFHPKSGDNMPCFKPTGAFSMRVFKPKDATWGILW
jgi:hypothetical protein